MNFFTNLLSSKGNENPTAAGSFPPAHKSSSTTTSPHTSPPVSPRPKPPPAAATSPPPAAGAGPRRPTPPSPLPLPDDHGHLSPPAGGEAERDARLMVHTLQAQLHALKKERATQDARYVTLAAEHHKDKELHEASLDQLRKRVASLNDTIALLREDRELLNRDVLVGREENHKLREENEQLRIMQGELTRQVKVLEEQLAAVADRELAARKFAANTRSIEDAQTDVAFRQRFNLPDTEFSIVSYYCCHKHIYHGWLYLTPAYVCFEPALLSNENSRITTPLTAITTLARVRGFKYIPGTDNGLIFKLKSGVEYFFNNFTHRDDVIANVVHQAAKFGHRIQSTQLDGEKQPPADADGKLPKRDLLLGKSKDTESLPVPPSSSSSSSSSATSQAESLPRLPATRARSFSDV